MKYFQNWAFNWCFLKWHLEHLTAYKEHIRICSQALVPILAVESQKLHHHLLYVNQCLTCFVIADLWNFTTRALNDCAVNCAKCQHWITRRCQNPRLGSKVNAFFLHFSLWATNGGEKRSLQKVYKKQNINVKYSLNSVRHVFKKESYYRQEGVCFQACIKQWEQALHFPPPGTASGGWGRTLLLDPAILPLPLSCSQPRLGSVKRMTPELFPRGSPAFTPLPRPLPVIWGGNFHPRKKTSLAFQHVSRCALFFFFFFT